MARDQLDVFRNGKRGAPQDAWVGLKRNEDPGERVQARRSAMNAATTEAPATVRVGERSAVPVLRFKGSAMSNSFALGFKVRSSSAGGRRGLSARRQPRASDLWPILKLRDCIFQQSTRWAQLFIEVDEIVELRFRWFGEIDRQVEHQFGGDVPAKDNWGDELGRKFQNRDGESSLGVTLALTRPCRSFRRRSILEVPSDWL